MRILALTNLYPSPYQPMRAAFNRQQFGALARRHEVAVIAPIAWTDEFRLRRKVGQRLSSSRRVSGGDGIEVEHPRYVFPPRVGRGWYGHCLRRCVRDAFARAVAARRPDVVLASWAYPDGWAAVRLAREAGLPVAVKVHGSDVRLLDGQRARRRRTAEALRAADAVVAVSRELRERVVSLGVDGRKVSVVYGGVDAGLFRAGPAAGARARVGVEGSDPLILYVGNLLPVKGLDVLVEACARLMRRGVAFDCRLVGQGSMRGALERMIVARGLAERVRLVGPRPLEQLPDWYRAARVLVLPSRSEGVPNVLLEATACGTPVVASRVGGVPEVLGTDHPGLVPPEDAEALAGAIERALMAGPAEVDGDVPIQSWDDSAAALADVLRTLAPAA